MIRPAVPADALAIGRVHVRSWQSGYAGILPAERLAALRPEERAARYVLDGSGPLRTFVADEEGAIVGLLGVGSERGLGLLGGLYVDPDHWRSGIGSALLQTARTEFVRAGHETAALWVLAGNKHAARFYRAHAWAPTGHTKHETIWGLPVDEIEYRTVLNPTERTADGPLA